MARPKSGGRWLRGVVVAARPEGHGLKREGKAENAKDRDAPYSRDRACSTELKLYWRGKEAMSRHELPRSRRARRDVQLGGGVNCRQREWLSVMAETGGFEECLVGLLDRLGLMTMWSGRTWNQRDLTLSADWHLHLPRQLIVCLVRSLTSAVPRAPVLRVPSLCRCWVVCGRGG